MTVQSTIKTEQQKAAASGSSAQHQSRAEARKEAAKHLYPSRARLLRHVGVTLLRVPTIGTILTFLLQPVVIAAFNTWVDYTGIENSTMFMMTVGIILHTAIAMAYYAFFAACDQFGFFKQYKLARTKRMMPSPGLRRKAFIHYVVFHCLWRVLLGYTLAYFVPYPPIDEPLESPFMVWLFWAWNTLFTDAFVWWYHKAQHDVKWMYSYHKIHHEFHATEVIATEYSDMSEILFYVVMNYFATAHKPIVMYFLIVLWRTSENHEAHSGYSFRGSWLSNLGFLNSYRTEFHDYHHSHNLGTYGYHIYMDYLMGTCDDFLLYQEKQGKSILD